MQSRGTAALALVGLFALALASLGPVPAATAGTDRCVTRAEFQQVHKGMTRRAVERAFDTHGRMGAGGAGGFSAAALISRVLTLAVVSSTGLGGATCSTNGFGCTGFSGFGASRVPAVSCDSSVAEMMSTGIDVTGLVSVGCEANATKLHARMPACPIHDMMTLVRIVPE